MALTSVGGQVGQFAGTAGSTPLTFALSGGTDAVPLEGDLVIVSFATGSTVDRDLLIRTSAAGIDYTEVTELAALDSSVTNLVVAYRFMPEPPETFCSIVGGTGSTADAGAWTVHVFRGVDPSTPLDVTVATATGINGRVANPPAITPTTAGAVILVVGAGAGATGGLYTAGYLTDFRATTQVDNTDVNIASGYLAWDGSGAYDPAAFGGGGTTTTADSWATVTLALRPSAAEVVGTLDVTLADVMVASTGLAAYAYEPPSVHKGQVYLSDVLSDGVFATTIAVSETSAQAGGV